MVTELARTALQETAERTRLCEEAFHCLLVPSYARPSDAFDNRHPLLNLERFGKNRIPPVCVLKEMRGWCCTLELCADFLPEMIRKRNAVRLGECCGTHPSGYAADLHYIRHHVVRSSRLDRLPHVVQSPPVLPTLDRSLDFTCYERMILVVNRIAMGLAEKAGSGWVSVRNTNHFGIAGYYVLKALERDLIGWAMTNSTKLVAPLWGTERMLGTNPIAIGFPGKREPPIAIDMATSVAAYGKVEMARRKGNPIPSGWTINSDGVVSTKPADMIEGGALLPLGSDREHGGHPSDQGSL
jgi:malate/lactate dehydrogenase-like protein